MIPVWFPWIFVGGSIFIVLSLLGSKYKEKEYRNIQYMQDFISGSIFVAFIGVLIPDIFPKFELPSFAGLSDSSDFELQIGPPRLIGR